MNIAIIPLSGVESVSKDTLQYARMIASDIRIIYAAIDEESKCLVKEEWVRLQSGYELSFLKACAGDTAAPILEYILEVQNTHKWDDFITVIIAEADIKKWSELLLHGKHENLLNNLLSKENLVVSAVPSQLEAEK